eukprot:TRINITY_DN1693_c0_g1_i1.p1 TRINITY_DN1693_c0_g1~~TRINITY_DN1693_c0_g1_i1.p1  ORF type:complete len:363 (-),score=84.49 TRINITY_DN1693_c0_g1_i1:67-1155(-)
MKAIFCFCILLCIFVSSTSATTDDIYVFQGNPYTQEGFDVNKDLTTINLWSFEGVKYHCIAHLPKVPGKYAVLYFIGGLGGIIPAEFYTDLMKRTAAHGYIVIGVDHIFGGVFPPSAEEVLTWLQQNLQSYIDEHAKGVVASWSHIGLGGHSGGSQSVLEMVLKDHTVANATLFLEGGWITKARHQIQRVDFSHPALVYATEFATKRSLILPQCGSFGQAEDLFNDWNSPRLLMNISGFGHCDILDPIGWEGCWLTDFCYTYPPNNRTLYRQFTQGLFSAFLGYYVQGNTNMLPYFTDKSQFLGITFTDFKVDLSGEKKSKKKLQQKNQQVDLSNHKFVAREPFFKSFLKKGSKQNKALVIN